LISTTSTVIIMGKSVHEVLILEGLIYPQVIPDGSRDII
jgi:hypothetical protein